MHQNTLHQCLLSIIIKILIFGMQTHVNGQSVQIEWNCIFFCSLNVFFCIKFVWMEDAVRCTGPVFICISYAYSMWNLYRAMCMFTLFLYHICLIYHVLLCVKHIQNGNCVRKCDCTALLCVCYEMDAPHCIYQCNR